MMSIRRGYRLMYLWCGRCHAERPHNRMKRRPSVAIIRARKSSNGPLGYTRTVVGTEQIPPEAVQVHAKCMICNHGAHFVTTTDRLVASFIEPSSQCICGLSWPHPGPHLEEYSYGQAG